MPLSRTWYTRYNAPVADNSTSLLLAKSIIFAFKSCLRGQASSGSLGDTDGGVLAAPSSSYWTCEGSSDGATAGMDGTDRWTASFDATKIVRGTAGVAHSWIVLKSPTTITTGPYYMMISWDTGSDQSLTVQFAKSPFTGGTATANPTAPANAASVMSSFTFAEAVTQPHRFHYTVDADGNFFFLTSKNTSGIFNWCIIGCALVDYETSTDTHVFFMSQNHATTGRGVPDPNSFANTFFRGRSYNNGAQHAGGHLRWGTGGMSDLSSTLGQNIMRTKWDTWPVHVVEATAGITGIRGKFPDLMLIGAAPVGSNDPNTTTPERVVAGGYLIPFAGIPTL